MAISAASVFGLTMMTIAIRFSGGGVQLRFKYFGPGRIRVTEKIW
jgi:hypothetical protein